jgi:hypothetical protein
MPKTVKHEDVAGNPGLFVHSEVALFNGHGGFKVSARKDIVVYALA